MRENLPPHRYPAKRVSLGGRQLPKPARQAGGLPAGSYPPCAMYRQGVGEKPDGRGVLVLLRAATKLNCGEWS